MAQWKLSSVGENYHVKLFCLILPSGSQFTVDPRVFPSSVILCTLLRKTSSSPTHPLCLYIPCHVLRLCFLSELLVCDRSQFPSRAFVSWIEGDRFRCIPSLFLLLMGALVNDPWLYDATVLPIAQWEHSRLRMGEGRGGGVNQLMQAWSMHPASQRPAREFSYMFRVKNKAQSEAVCDGRGCGMCVCVYVGRGALYPWSQRVTSCTCAPNILADFPMWWHCRSMRVSNNISR